MEIFEMILGVAFITAALTAYGLFLARREDRERELSASRRPEK